MNLGKACFGLPMSHLLKGIICVFFLNLSVASFAQYYGQIVEDEDGNQYKLTEPNRYASAYGNPYPMPRNFSRPNFDAGSFRPQDTIAPTQRALENYAAAEERRMAQEENLGWQNLNRIQEALARGASIADQQSILEARKEGIEAQKLANERERMAQRQLALEEELTRRRIAEIDAKNNSPAPIPSSQITTPPSVVSSKALENYAGHHEIPAQLEAYKTKISKLLAQAKKDIDIHIVKGNLAAARDYEFALQTLAFLEDEQLRKEAGEFIKDEIEKFKVEALK